MIINQSVGFTFIHIPKSAGTSVTRFLSPLNGPLDLEIGGTDFGEEIQPAYIRRYQLRKHSTFADTQTAIAMARPPRDMFVFTFVRNPYARLSSIFSFLRKWENYDPDLLRMMKTFADFREFVASGLFMRRPGPDSMFRPQCDWLRIDGMVSPQIHCFRIEDVETAMDTITHELAQRGADLSLLPVSFPHTNKSDSQPIEGLCLSDDLMQRVNDYYAEDFKAFGYSHGSLQ